MEPIVLGPTSSEGLLLLGAVALGASCGFRIFLAPFVLSLLGVLGALPDGPALASSPWVALAAMALVLIEVGGDKLRGFDHALDAAGLVLRPAWAAALVLGFAPTGTGLIPSVVAAGMALLVGIGKTRLRIESAARGTWQAPLVSLMEDVASAVLVAVALVAPLPALVGWGLVGTAAHLWATLLGRRRWQVLAAEC
jgi:hypothetical protein